MSAKITITLNGDIASVKIVGQPTCQDIIATLEKLSDGGKFISSRRFWDLQECQLDLSPGQVKAITSYAKQLEHTHSKVAVVAVDDLTFGMSRMHQVFRESDYTSTKVFRDEKEAMSWLLSD